jgi:hypothetical protein
MTKVAPRWMRRHEAARYAGVSVKTLTRWRLPIHRIGRIVIYAADDIDRFLTAHRHLPVTDKARPATLPLQPTRRRKDQSSAGGTGSSASGRAAHSLAEEFRRLLTS